MKGKHFLLADEQGQILNGGVVESQLNADTYLCRFRGKVPMSRVVTVDQMQNFLIFDSEQHVDQWMTANIQQPAQDNGLPPGVEVVETEAGEELKPEDLPEGIYDPESKLTPVEQLMDHLAKETAPADA
jgi:hypothetical protein